MLPSNETTQNSYKKENFTGLGFGGFLLVCFLAVVSVQVINLNFVLLWLGFWLILLLGLKKNKSNLLHKAVSNIHCSGLNICLVLTHSDRVIRYLIFRPRAER